MEQIETSTSGGEMGWGGVEPNKCILLDQKINTKNSKTPLISIFNWICSPIHSHEVIIIGTASTS